MSNLIPRPGTTPLLNPEPTVQALQVASLPPDAAGDEIDLRELWRALRRRKRLVGVTAAAMLALASLVTAYQRLFKPVYEGGFQLLIADPVSDGAQAGAGSAEQGIAGTPFEQLALNTTRSDLPTLIEVLESPLLLAPIARRYGLRTNDLAKTITITSGGSKQKEAEGVLKISLTGTNPQRDQKVLADLSKAYLAYSLSQRQQRLAEGLKFLDRQAPALQAKTTEIQAELAQFRRTHNLLEPKEEGMALKLQITTFEQERRSLEAERSRLQAARRGILAGSLSARGFQEAIGSGSAGNTTNGGMQIAGSRQGELEQLAKLDEQIADGRSRYASNSAMLRGLEARRAALLPLLRQDQLLAVDTALALNSSRLSTATAQQSQLNTAFQRQPALIKQYEDLDQKLQIAQNNLEGLIKARENFQLEIAQRTEPWAVIAEPQMNPDPVKPSVPRNLALGVVLGLVAGAGAGLLRDRLDHVFHSPAEVKDELPEPLLGHIPHVPFFKGVREDNRFLIEELDRTTTSDTTTDQSLSGYQRFFYQEAFRNLFTSLRFLNSGQPLRSLALTSSLPAEGKSLVNVLLAKTLSEMGQRVLLVDADLRKPQIHHRLGVNNLTGLSNLLTETDLHWRDVIQPVVGYEGWNVLTAGRRPPDPARLLSSLRMHDLVRELADSDQFDLILYDTPPVLGLADAALVAEHLDGLMLLVSLNRVDRSLPKEAAARIRSAGASLLGVVTNAVKEETASNSTYGYGYGGYRGYGYGGYGYGAYDPRSTYAYYQREEQAASPASPTTPGTAGLGKRLRTTSGKLMRWLDA
jgi:succinoglycan biosynthesis transport protein ExoP